MRQGKSTSNTIHYDLVFYASFSCCIKWSSHGSSQRRTSEASEMFEVIATNCQESRACFSAGSSRTHRVGKCSDWSAADKRITDQKVGLSAVRFPRNTLNLLRKCASPAGSQLYGIVNPIIEPGPAIIIFLKCPEQFSALFAVSATSRRQNTGVRDAACGLARCHVFRSTRPAPTAMANATHARLCP